MQKYTVREAVAKLQPEIAAADLRMGVVAQLRERSSWFAAIPADLVCMLLPMLQRRKVWPGDLHDTVQAAQSAFETTYAANSGKLSLTRYAAAHPHEAVEHQSMIHVKQRYGICRIAEHWLPAWCLTIGAEIQNCAVFLRGCGYNHVNVWNALPCGLLMFSNHVKYILICPRTNRYVELEALTGCATDLIDDFGHHMVFPKNSGGFNPHSMFESSYVADQYII